MTPLLAVLCKYAYSSEDRDRIREDETRRAFAVNDAVDPGSDMPESNNVNLGRKIGATLPSLTPKIPAATSLPKPPKIKALDGRTDKPEGMNLMQGIQTVSGAADIGSSYTSFGRRAQGSPT